MDTPLTTAELSRLRKAIQQRERLLSQGLSAPTAESNIARALSNLRLYLSQSQPQLGAVLKDWEGADQPQRSQIVAWLRENVLKAQASLPEPSQAAPPAPVSRSNFVAPPPPPALPTRTKSLSSQSPPTSHHHTRHASTSPNVASQSILDRPIPTLSPNLITPFGGNQATPTPPRELYTQAVLKPPTPPPKDYPHSRTPSLARQNSLGRPDRPNFLAQLNTSTSANNSYPNLSASPVQTNFSPQPQPPTPVNRTRPSLIQSVQSQSSGSNTGSTTCLQMGEPHQPPPHSQSYSQHTTNSLGAGNINPYSSPTQSSPSNPTLELLSKMTAAYRQQYQSILSQTSQPSTSAPAPTTTPSTSTNTLLEAIKKYQADQVQSALSQSQSSSQQPMPSSDSLQQVLAAFQQQQQEQTNQFLSAFQQQQQSTLAFDPSQYIVQSQQQSQQILETFAQMQGNPSSAGIDWASFASGGSGVDFNSLLGAGGGAGVDWGSVATMMGGMDPTGVMAVVSTLQGAGLF